MTAPRDRPPAIFLMGPTASGKTELAVHLAACLPLDIISVDSALVYRGMDIGTAKPDTSVLARAPHRLVDICDPAEAYSAARFREDALREMADITASGRHPLLVGGTMLYFRALEQGLAELPSADAELRERLSAWAGREGLEALHRRLAEVDAESAARIHPRDPQRILRALEVYELTGRPLSDWHRRAQAADFPYRTLKLIRGGGDRGALRARIAERFLAMLDAGFEDEVRRLLARGDLDPELPAMRAVGYRQMAAFLRGEMDRETMVQRAIDASRQLAKRQLTWLRQEADACWLAPGEQGAAEAEARVRRFIARS